MSTKELKALKGKKAFTLIELLIVVIIIAILAAIAIPKFINSSLRSKEASLKAELKLIRDGVELEKNDTGVFVANLSDLTLTTAPVNGKDNNNTTVSITSSLWRGPYISSVDPDPVNNAAAFSYNIVAGVASVKCSDAGNDSTGAAYISSY